MSRKTAKAAQPTKRRKSKKPKKSKALKPRQTREPTAPPRKICSMCHEPHEGDSEESFDSLAVLDPEAVVYYDRDVVAAANVDGLCGPRFRQNGVGLYAHYGSPGGANYVVYQWKIDDKRWKLIIHWHEHRDVMTDREASAAAAAAGGSP